MKLWKFNKRSSTLADMSMNRVLLTELIAKGALVGVIAGFFGASYRYLILESEHIRWHLMDDITMEWAIGWLVVMVIFAFIVDRLLAWAPLSGGSGIPQIEGEMLGLFDMKPYRTLVSKMIGGVLTGFAGFSVGREGPAVQIGGSAGKIVSYWMNSGLREQRILTSAGAGAGLTAPFSATSRWSFETGHLDGLLLEELKEAAGLAAHDFTLRFEYSEADPGNWCADTTAVIQHSAHESLTDLQYSVLENNSYNWTKEDVKALQYEPWQWDDEDEQPEFTALELFILETEKKTWKYQGTKEKHIHQTGTAPLTYYQTLNRMLDDERVEAREPELVHRLRKKRDAI